jgi:hypothetical protein
MASMARVSDHDVAKSHLELEQRIRERAYEIYLARGGAPGKELEDWLQAEHEVVGGSTPSDTINRATTVGYAGRPDFSRIGELGEV